MGRILCDTRKLCRRRGFVALPYISLFVALVVGCAEDFRFLDGYDDAWVIVQLSDGGILLAGRTNTCGDPEGLACTESLLIVRTDFQGMLRWEKRFPSLEEPADIALTSDDDVVVAGSHPASITRLDIDGNVLWSRSYGDTNELIADDILVSPDGGIVIGGLLVGQDGREDRAFLLKTDGDGNEIWRTSLGIADADVQVRDLASTNDEGIILVGAARSFDTGKHRVYVTKVSGTGSELWGKSIALDGVSISIGTGVAPMEDGGAVISGWGLYEGHSVPALVAVDASGEVLWHNWVDLDEGSGAFFSVIRLESGDLLFSGERQFGPDREYSKDAFVQRTDSLGNELWSRDYGGTLDDYVLAAIQTSANAIALAGATRSFGVLGTDVYFLTIDGDGNELGSYTYAHEAVL